MKKIFLFLTISLFSIPAMYAVVTWDGTSSEMWTQGTGTEADPYLIETPANLAYLSAQVTAGETYTGVYFQQTEDFDLQSKTWTPIGTSTYKFAGIYNGANKYVSNIKTNQYGLFGITENTKIKNISFQGTYSSSSASVSAPLIGTAQGVTEIVNCHNQATITGACAGLIANATGTSISLHKCSNQEGITYSTSVSPAYAGGLVARVTTKNLATDACFNKGDISATTSGGEAVGWYNESYVYAGGLFGSISSDESAVISNSFNEANIVAKSTATGGNYGTNYYTNAAGIVGSSLNCSVVACFHKGNISGTACAGIFNGKGNILACYVRGSIGTSSYYDSDKGWTIYTLYAFAPWSGSNVESSYSVLTNSFDNYAKINMSPYCLVTGLSNTYYSYPKNLNTGIYRSDIIMKDASTIPLLNTIDDYFTMDLEGINDGYPILKWQAGPRFTITGSCDANRGTVKGGGEYAPGNTVTLTATPKKGCTFVGWSDGVTDNPRTVTVEGDATYRAQFIKSSYTIYVNQDCTNYIE